MEHNRKRGRPPLPPDRRRVERGRLRLNAEEQARLDRLSARYQENESAVIRRGLIALERNPVRTDE
jgi:hypothetical protein